MCLPVRGKFTYWLHLGDVHFVQRFPTTHDPLAREGAFYRWAGNCAYAYNLVEVLPQSPITRACFEATLVRLAEHIPLEERPEKLTALGPMAV